MPIGRMLSSRMPGTQFAVLSLLPLRIKLLNCVLLLLLQFHLWHLSSLPRSLLFVHVRQ